MAKSLVALGAVLGMTLALPATPVAAQSAPSGKKISQIIVYGDDPCPRATDDEIYVCARRPAEERYRIPETLRKPGAPQQRQSWAVRARTLDKAGQRGIDQCSPVGPGGFTGCSLQEINAAAEDTATQETAPKK